MIANMSQFEEEKNAPQHFENSDVEKTSQDSFEDGELRWTLKSIIATASLCGIWTGEQISHSFRSTGHANAMLAF